jgi:NAD(P)-dependent dehydrogenase (short-subunit alcohol dehydrogenase family)
MRSPGFSLQGKRALVTGGSRGIGLAAAHALAEAGANLVIAARNAQSLDETAQDIRAKHGVDVAVWPLNVVDSDQVRRGMAAYGPFDIVVNSAGGNRPAVLLDVQDSDLDEVLDLNVKSVFYVCREAARGMQEHGIKGSIINVSSQMGHVGGPKRTVYCATKHALEGFTKALAWELGPHGIRVNTLCPTFIETDMTRSMLEDPEFREFVISSNALRRLGQVEDLMGPVVFLASDASALVTGSALMVDAGWTAV